MSNIILIGMPGAGKSTVGVLLAEALGMGFIDTDSVIEVQEGRGLQDIINADGIDTFLKIEEKVVVSMDYKNAVIATGGSVVYSKAAMNRLKKDGTVVYLEVVLDEIIDRVDNITTRGIVLGENQSLNDIHTARVPLYNKYADMIVHCTDRNIEQIIQNILEHLKKK